MDIKEGIKAVLKTYANFGYDRKVEEMVNYLKSQGVVQKVEGELPRCINRENYNALKKAGYCKVEEL